MTRQQEQRRQIGPEGRPILLHTLAQTAPHRLDAGGANERLRAAFDSYLARQARTTGTRRKYGDAIGHYTDWLQERAPGTVAAEEIDRYLEHWRDQFLRNNGRGPATASYRAQINALRAFYAYLDRFSLITDPHGRPTPDPMRKILPPRSQPASNDWLRPAEDTALLTCPAPCKSAS